MTHWSGLSWRASVLEALRCVWPAHVNKQRGGAFILAGLLRCSDVMLRVALNTLRKGIFVSLPFFWFIISKCLKLKTCRRFRFIFCVFMNISVHPPQAPPPRLRSTVIFQSDLMLKKTYIFFQWKHLNSCRLKQEKAHLNSRTATSHTTTTYPSSQREIPDTHTWSSQSALSDVDFKSD